MSWANPSEGWRGVGTGLAEPGTDQRAKTGPMVFIRRLLTATLLVVALATLAVFFGREMGLWRVPAVAPAEPSAQATSGPRITVFSLHGQVRCPNCALLGGALREVLRESFDAEVKAGRLEFQEENYEAPGNERFGQVYQVVSEAVLLVESREGRVVRWRNLAGLWEHAATRAALKRSLSEQIRAFLDPAPPGLSPHPEGPPGPVRGWALWLAVASAFGLGLLATVSPCALATQMTALALLGGPTTHPRQVLMRGVVYSAGRMLAYMGVGLAMVSGLVSAAGGAGGLVKYFNGLLGPVLMVAGLFVLGWLRVAWSVPVSAPGLEQRATNGRLWPVLAMGGLLALAFCPLGAALFFGGLIPLAVRTRSGLLLPGAYGLATGLPVVVLALLVAGTSRAAAHWFKCLRPIEAGLRRGAGAVFVGVGFHYAMRQVFGVW